MNNEMELQQIVYNTVVMQIQFGTFRYCEHLPKMEEAAQWLLVSMDTIRSVYGRLRREGYITQTKSAGAVVKVRYRESEIKQNIRDFFSCRKDALTDLSQSVCPLFTRSLSAGMKKASPEQLDEIERLCRKRGPLPPYEVLRHLQNLYKPLKNDMLMRLLWQYFMFFQAPFLSIREHLITVDEIHHPLLKMVALCKKNDDAALEDVVNAEQHRMYLALCRLYETYDIPSPAANQIAFSWNSYKKSSQICYSLGLDLLTGITQGVYPAGTLLPSLEDLAREKQVSVSTVRRTLSLLNDIGAAKSINGVGTKILSPDQICENCDFTKASVRKRLLDFMQSMQIFVLSCKEVTKITVESLDTAAIAEYRELLHTIQQSQQYEMVPYRILRLIIHLAPYQTIKTVYASLYQQLLWGYPLRGIRSSREAFQALHLRYLDTLSDCLDHSDADGLSASFEAYMLEELRCAVAELVKLGIEEAADYSL